MGSNENGQLGDGGALVQPTPVQVATGVVAVSAGSHHSLFLRPVHTVTFDPGAHGTRSGGGALVQEVLETDTATAPTLSVASGWALAGWDTSFDSVTTTRTVTARYVVPEAPLIMIQPVSRTARAGTSTTLRLAASGNAPATPLVYQWYRGETGNSSVPVPGATGPLLVTPILSGSDSYWVRISNAGATTDSEAATISISSTPLNLGTMGANAHGQLGDGTTTGRDALQQVATGVARVSAGGEHTLFIKADGTLWAVGRNSRGQLGDGTTTERTRPVQIATGVRFASAGREHSHFIKTDGTLWAMGDNDEGQLGDGTTTERPTPRQIATQVAFVSSGGAHTLFIKTDGTLWATGLNDDGQLGDGSTTRRLAPLQIATGVATVSAGARHSLFLKADGTLWGMGENSWGQLGNPYPYDPVTLPALIATDVVTASAGYDHTLFAKADGTLWGMGSDHYGQLGVYYGGEVYAPTQLAADVVGVSAGAYESCFLKPDSSLWSLRAPYTTPFGGSVAPVLVLGDITEVSTGLNHTALLSPSAIPTAYDNWVAPYAFNASDALPEADPDADGVPNLLEYAFDTSPAGAAPSDMRPISTLELVDGVPHLVLTHRRHSGRLLTYIYEKSTDLHVWVPVAPYTSVSIPSFGPLHLVSARILIGDEPRLFLRVSVCQ